MPLVIALGFTMGSMRWFANELGAAWLILIWTIAAVWIYFVLTLFLGWGAAERIELVRKVDMAMRWFIGIAITIIGLMSFIGSGIAQENWLAANTVRADQLSSFPPRIWSGGEAFRQHSPFP